MHELSICTALVELVSAELQRQAPEAKLLKAVVAVGDLRQVIPETLTFAYEALVAGTRLAGSTLEIRHVPITARCGSCAWEGAVGENYFICPKCASHNLDLLTGRELHLESLEVEENEPK